MKTIVLLITIAFFFAQPALSADTGVQLIGAEKAAEAVTGGGGAGTGTEMRYYTAAAEAHWVAGCSEPLDGGDTLENSDADSDLSPNETECWGRGGDWQLPTFQGANTMPINSVTGWGDVTLAAEQPNGGGDWWLAYKPTQIAGDFGLTSATICVRYYKQVPSNYQTASYNCPCVDCGTTRNKLTEIEVERFGSPGLYDAYQIQEDQHDGCDTIANGRNFMACYGSGPAEEPGCVHLSPGIKFLQAVSHPVRIEQCVEATNIATGENHVVKAYVTRLDTNVTSYHATPSGLTLGALHGDSTSFGDIDHTGNGTGSGQSWQGYFMFAIWDDVNGHTI